MKISEVALAVLILLQACVDVFKLIEKRIKIP